MLLVVLAFVQKDTFIYNIIDNVARTIFLLALQIYTDRYKTLKSTLKHMPSQNGINNTIHIWELLLR